MNKHCFLKTFAIVMAVCFSSCGGNVLEVDSELLGEKLYEPTAVKYEKLEPATVLYLDHSTCIIDAIENSQIFRALRPNLGQYCDALQLIKGTEFETIPLNRQANRVSAVLETMRQDIPFADIRRAVFQICESNQQAVLISDCESYYEGRFLDREPFMTEPFIKWLKNGHTIYVIAEPYREKYNGAIYDKKRFYFIFTDDRMEAPISENMLAQLQPLKDSGLFYRYKITNSDIQIKREGKMLSADLDISDVIEKAGFEYVEINDDWNTIREYVMKLDEYGEPLQNDEGTGNAIPLPLIENLVFNDSENYQVNDVKVVATNVTTQYLAIVDSTVTSNPINISDAFAIDKEALQNHTLNVLLTEKIFKEGYLTDEYGGNLIRLDYVITNATSKPYNEDNFKWQSMFSNEQAICVSKSIENALCDIGVVPTCDNRKLIHTVFIKTRSYK
jgi:hypothetical protein